MGYDAIVIGVSAGGLAALSEILPALKQTLPVPIIVVQHMSPESDGFLSKHLDSISAIQVCEAEDKMALEEGVVYIAPPNYHLLVENDRTLALSVEDRVNFSRPSIDVLFASAAEVYFERLIGVVLTGANADGTAGLQRIKALGGLAVVQDPENAEVEVMPRSALNGVAVDYIVSLEKIGPLLNKLVFGK